MGLNAWWDTDSDQRYWMEVATTGAMGEILIAPKFQGASWSYELVSRVDQGDVVLHWQSEAGSRGLVGWSVATGSAEVVDGYMWQPRGTVGRALPGPRTTQAWQVTLGGFNQLTHPVMSQDLQTPALRDKILGVAADLEAAHGKPIYFPFYLYGGQQLRATQGYLLKFPAELLDILPINGLVRAMTARDLDADVDEETQPPKTRMRKGRVTRVQDPVLRAAIENHAVDRAIEYYGRVGGSDFAKLGKPYDIRLNLDGVERHVEVKGSSLSIETVELTINEVEHARSFHPTDLVVVDGIEYERTPKGIVTSGGRMRVWTGWEPDSGDLVPRRFAYNLPEV